MERENELRGESLHRPWSQHQRFNVDCYHKLSLKFWTYGVRAGMNCLLSGRRGRRWWGRLSVTAGGRCTVRCFSSLIPVCLLIIAAKPKHYLRVKGVRQDYLTVILSRRRCGWRLRSECGRLQALMGISYQVSSAIRQEGRRRGGSYLLIFRGRQTLLGT